ncbi:hypothetical protein JNN96_22595 [Mycobacterium sp. DSM 3803]|nr:hypothetical protein [Mycobacterium sp. DSM 3803]
MSRTETLAVTSDRPARRVGPRYWLALILVDMAVLWVTVGLLLRRRRG